MLSDDPGFVHIGSWNEKHRIQKVKFPVGLKIQHKLLHLRKGCRHVDDVGEIWRNRQVGKF